MHKEILNENQLDLLPLLKKFKREYYLVGGTAIALYLGHRRSIDFDLFKFSEINHWKNIEKLSQSGCSFSITRRVAEQMNININNVKLTFFRYPFDIKTETILDELIKIPSLLDLAAMKAYALGRRSKWKDYVDLFFLIRDHFSIHEISIRARQIFGDMFSEKQFLAQLSYFKDIDYSEAIEYLDLNPLSDKTIMNFLIEKSTDVL